MEQNYKKHAMIDPHFHYVLAPLVIIIVILAIIQFVSATQNGDFSLTNVILVIGSVMFFLIVAKMRLYVLRLQDRIIRSEESFRYFVLTGKRLDINLSIKQLIALRFASDEEFPTLVLKTVEENLMPEQIKQSVKEWRADYYRV
ncbi:hypothetical protein GH741_01575 [Aquibacillus halophilus]|uniref:Uncharacterized protein n=1 Tax=Aquibacillus halophilus TaxID=930132 RepID=A0A6A8D7W6_9BACI|nr:DUF6526 family protein [Aquibacillus halophilus]MRH41360.1 hypothetical protein [Aquibacillus halophilus]